MIPEYEAILARSAAGHAEIIKKMRHLSKLNKSGFDKMVHAFHDEVFAEIDCMKCANCCRNLGPRFRETDIKLLCKATGENIKAFKAKYLKADDEGIGYVLKELPCPFQNDDLTCSEYELRTLSCVEFPHTKEKNVQKHLVRLAHNSLVCPAAFLIIERIMRAQ